MESVIMGRRIKVGFMMLVCTLLLSFGVFSGNVLAWESTLHIEGGTEGTDWNYGQIYGDVFGYTINKPGDYSFKMNSGVTQTNDVIQIDSNDGEVNITFDNVTIVTGDEYGAINITWTSTVVNLKLKGTNTITRDGNGAGAGLSGGNGGSLNITGDKLIVKNKGENDDGISSSGMDINIGGGATIEINSKRVGIPAANGGDITINGGATVKLDTKSHGVLIEDAGKLTITDGAKVTINSSNGNGIASVPSEQGTTLTVSKKANLSVTTTKDGGACIMNTGDVIFTEGATASLTSTGNSALIVYQKGDVKIDEGAIVSFVSTANGANAGVVFADAEKSTITLNGRKAVIKGKSCAIIKENGDSEFGRIKFGDNMHINYLGDSEDSKAVATDDEVKGATDKKYLEVLAAYPITYEYNGGTPTKGNPATYTAEDEITISNPTRSGYEFTGWTGTDIKEATKTLKIPKGSHGPRTYTATWKETTPVTPATVPAVKTAPVAREALCYTGKDQALIIAGEATDGHMEYALGTATVAPTSGWSTAIPVGKEEGTYTIWYRAADDKGSTTPASVKVSIYALKVTLKKSSSNYNGKKPKIEVKSVSYAGKKISFKAKDYKLSYSPKTVKKAGKYTVTLTVTKKGAYKGKTGVAIYTIKQLNNTLTVKRLKKTIAVKASAIKAKAKTIKIKDVAKISKQQGKLSYEPLSGSSDKIEVNKTNGSMTVPMGLAKGKYPVKVKVTAAGNTNYKPASKTLSVTIQIK